MKNLKDNLETLFSKFETFVSSKTVVGEAIHVEDLIIIPLIDISFGVGAKSSDDTKTNKESDLGGLGGRITPSSVLVIQNGSVQLINIKNQDGISKLIDLVPSVLSKLKKDSPQ